jgi:hypothetical protein
VLDPATLRDTASFAAPDRFPTGIEHVFINGAHVLDESRYDAAAGAGQVLRSERCGVGRACPTGNSL